MAGTLELSGGILSSSGTLVLGSLMLLEEDELVELLELELLEEDELELLELLEVPPVEQPPVQPVIPRARTSTAAVSRSAIRFVFI